MTLGLIFVFFACWCLKDWLFPKGEVFQILLLILFIILAFLTGALVFHIH